MQYLDKLSRIAHWELPKEEAAEIMKDYQEMLEDSSSAGKKLSCENPYRFIKELRDNRQYFLWLFAFSLMLTCLLSVGICLLLKAYSFGIIFGLYLLGQGAAAFYFQITDKGKLSLLLPRSLILLLGLEAFGLLIIVGISIGLYGGPDLLFIKNLVRPENVGGGTALAVQLVAAVVTAISVFGIYQARITDRRWRALYHLGITIVVLCVLVFSVFYDTDLSGKRNIWYQAIAFLTIGCVATGVSFH